MTCPTYEADRLTGKYLDELVCQYSESPNLRAVLTAVLRQLEVTECNAIDLCDCLNIDVATGECLTAIGEIVGWPRTHCAAQDAIGFGFSCTTDPCATNDVLGWCSGEWQCDSTSTGKKDYTFINDELYRSFLKAKTLANRSIGMTLEILAVAQALLGDEVCLGQVDGGVLQIIVPRPLTAEEDSIIELIRRILPVSVAVNDIQIVSGGLPFGWYCSDTSTGCTPAGWCTGTWIT